MLAQCLLWDGGTYSMCSIVIIVHFTPMFTVMHTWHTQIKLLAEQISRAMMTQRFMLTEMNANLLHHPEFSKCNLDIGCDLRSSDLR